MRTSLLICICFFISTDALPSILEGHLWYLPNHKNRILVKVNRRAGSREAFIEFYSGGLCREDGSGIMVADSYGKIMRREITTIGPGDRYLVTFELTKSNVYYIYYNNPGVSRIPTPYYHRRSGLLLEVFRLVGDDCKDIDDLTTIVAESRQLLGSGYRRRIFDGYNPYADSDNYLAVYTGFLNIKDPGTYQFATNSSDASFLFVDSKLVASFPGKHFAWATHGQKHGNINLKTGIHRITYYHVEFLGGQAAVAGWKRPGAKRFEVIPQQAFLPIGASEIVARESNDGHFWDYTFSYGEVLYPRRFNANPLIEMTFQAYLSKDDNVRDIYWDFGDGQIVRGKSPSRIFLRSGLCTVKMSVIDKENLARSMTHTVPVYPIDRFNAKQPDETAERFERMLAEYNSSFFSHEELMTLFNFYLSRDNDNMVVRIGSRLAGSFTEGEVEEKVKFLERFGEYLQKKPINHVALRERIYSDILSSTDNKYLVAKASLKLANAYYEQYDKRDKAKELCENVIKADYAQLGRGALIGLGNIALEENKTDKAAEYYRKASGIKLIRTIRFDMIGLHSFAIENHIKNGKYNEALLLLRKWETHNPMARLEGQTLMLRVRILQKKGDTENAIRYSKILVDNLDTTPYTAEAYSVLIELLRQARRTHEADKYLRQFRDKLPHSEYLKQFNWQESDIVELQTGKER